MTKFYRRRAFTLIELLVVISIIALLIAILLPALGAARLTARKMQNNSNLRSIHQSYVIYGGDRKSWYPGIVEGQVMTVAEVNQAIGSSGITFPNGFHGGHPSARLSMVVLDDILSTDFLISPGETNRTAWDRVSVLTGDNDSYAQLQIFTATAAYNGILTPAGRSWQNDVNTQTPIIADRTTATTASGVPGKDEHSSIWNEDAWEGGVAWGDGHTETLSDPTMPLTNLAQTKIQDDHLFDPGRSANSYDGILEGFHVRMVKRTAVGTVFGGD
jgi:prepilin-type N-terminal cleavage/methylation domain-containing protein